MKSISVWNQACDMITAKPLLAQLLMTSDDLEEEGENSASTKVRCVGAYFL